MQEIEIWSDEEMVYAQSASVLENDTQTPVGLWHTNVSPNLGQKTRPYNNQQQKKRTCKIVDFAFPGWPQNKTEKMWKEK